MPTWPTRRSRYIADLRAVDAGQAVLHVLLPGRRPCAAPCRAASGSTRYRGQFDQGWERWRETVFARQLAMGIIPPGHRAQRAPAMGQGLGHAERRRAAAVRAPDGGLRRLSGADRPPHRPRARSRSSGAANSTTPSSCWRPTTAPRPRAARHGSFNECQFPNRYEASIAENLQHLDDWGSVKSYPNYCLGLGLGRQHAAAALEALSAPGRHERPVHRALAARHRGARRDPQPVHPRHRRRCRRCSTRSALRRRPSFRAWRRRRWRA